MKLALLLKHEVSKINKRGSGGTEQVFLDDIKLLSKAGHSVIGYARFSNKKLHIVKLSFSKFLYKLYCLLQSSRFINYYLSLPIHTLQFFVELMYTFNFIRQQNQNTHVIGYSTPLLSLFRKKSIVIIHNSHHQFFFSTLFKNGYSQSTFLFCSKYLLRNYRQRYSFLNKDNSKVLYNAIDPHLFQAHRDKTSLSKNTPLRFLYASAWNKCKGLDLLVNTFLHLPSSVTSNCQLTIASHPLLWHQNSPSDQIYYQMIKNKIKKTSNIVLLNGIEHQNMPPIYSSHDWTIVPSLWQEPFGLVALESIACHTPVIAFKSGGLPEILSPDNSIITKPSLLSQTIINIVKKNHKLKCPSIKNYDMIEPNRINKLINIINSQIVKNNS